MPIVTIELLSGRSKETKAEVARAVTVALYRIAGVQPGDTTVIFREIKPADWMVAGRALAD